MDNNPILNSPYSEPRWHYSTDLSGQLNYEDIRPGRRIFDPALGGYSMPVGKQKQSSLLEVNEFQAEYGTHLINLTHEQVRKWREQEYPNVTGATKTLLEYWFLNAERPPNRCLFFAQREAIESGLVKIPFLPELDNTQQLQPVLRNFYEHVRNDLPRKGQKTTRKESKTAASAALTTSPPSERVILSEAKEPTVNISGASLRSA